MSTIEHRYLANNDLFASSELCLKLLRACHKHSCVDGQLRAQLQEDLGSEVMQAIQIANICVWWECESQELKSFARWGEWSAWSVWCQSVDFVDLVLCLRRREASPTCAALRPVQLVARVENAGTIATLLLRQIWMRHETFWTWNLFRLVWTLHLKSSLVENFAGSKV